MNIRSFTLQSNNGKLRNLITDIAVSKPFDALNSDEEKPMIHKLKGLWDTGATGTVITKEVADMCGIKPIGKVQSNHAGGSDLSNVYKANIYLPNQVYFNFVTVTEAKLTGFDVLIGMDIITAGDFAITNVGGKTTFSYRYPSQKSIDFVEQDKRFSKGAPKIPRNSICPCGSGKKHKHCCGKV